LCWVSLDTLQLTVYLPEDSYGQVKLGQAAQMTVDSYPGVNFTGFGVHRRSGRVTAQCATVEGRTTVYAIKLTPNPEGKLKPGMPADVKFDESGPLPVKEARRSRAGAIQDVSRRGKACERSSGPSWVLYCWH
jgi:hypothetical protein